MKKVQNFYIIIFNIFDYQKLYDLIFIIFNLINFKLYYKSYINK